MLQATESFDDGGLADRLRNAGEADVSLMTEVMGMACRISSLRHTEKADRLEQFIRSGAWTDAALTLIDLELPLWQVRRLAYDAGEWHCALSRERELPDWLDSAVEAHHADLPLAILGAFVEVRSIGRTASRTSVPTVRPIAPGLDEPVGADNFS